MNFKFIHTLIIADENDFISVLYDIWIKQTFLFDNECQVGMLSDVSRILF